MKKYGALLLLSAAMLVAVPAYNNAWAAQPAPSEDARRGGPHHGGFQHPDITPEQRAAYEKIMNDHYNKVQPVRNDLWAKQTELDYLSRSDKAEPKTISRMVGEIKTLREKLQAEHKATTDKLAKDFGINSEHAYGLMRGHRGGYAGGDCGCEMSGPRGGFHGGHNSRGHRR